MATTTSVNLSTELVSTASIGFIRPIVISIHAKLLKPSTNMYAFFDGENVNRFFKQQDKQLGEQLVTDSAGELMAEFYVPGQTYTTGDKEILLLDYADYNTVNTLGAAVVKARALFSSKGTLQTYQTTETTVITTTTVIPVPNFDPLAQSFFTYGVQGGCFITSVDLFFFTKDDTLPVWIEIREMVNGYPAPTMVTEYAKCILNPAAVLLSANGSVATNFKFNKLIYLKQDHDYCFVVRSNSSKYNLWTSKLSEKSNETGNIMFEQPYMGSLFKSENNITWTAEQTEDIKFTIKKAEFNTSVDAMLNIALIPNAVSVDSNIFQTITGQSRIYVQLPYKHGLNIGSKISIAASTTGVYNGIAGSLLNGDFTVLDIKSEYIIGFDVPGATATTTGPIISSGQLETIYVNAQGQNYPDTTTVSITGGTGATATPVIVDGKIVQIKIVTTGSGFTSPVISITGAGGSGASAIGITAPKFTISTNRMFHAMKPLVNTLQPSGTDISSTLTTTVGSYEDGTTVQYAAGKTYDIDINDINYFDDNLLLVTRKNQIDQSMDSATDVSFKLSTTNKNVSPVIEFNQSRVVFRTNSINNQKSESIVSTNSSGYVQSFNIINPGVGYSSPPTVTVSGTGSGGSFTAVLGSGINTGKIVDITVNSGGTGYYGTANVYFEGGGPTTPATATVNLSDYNSELKSDYGTALSRYITKKQTLKNISSSIRVYATAFSNIDSSFEVYVKTSLSTGNTNHDVQEWTLLKCDSTRNKSQTVSQYLEYEFYFDGMPQFDVYSLKFVLRTKTPWQPPIISNYRAIILA